MTILSLTNISTGRNTSDMNTLATVEIIHHIEPHPDADKIVLARILGFQVIVNKDQFVEGERVIYVWPDTICQPAPWNAFLDKNSTGKPVKIKSCKLRGQFSSGLVVPISNFPAIVEANFPEGEDVSVLIGVQKYVKEESVPGGDPAGSFPSQYISKTDETQAQGAWRAHEEFNGEEVYVTLKIDGQSLTFIRYGDEVTVCSRNLKIKEGDNRFWNSVRKYGLVEKTVGMNIAIQAEQYGPAIQKNPHKESEIKLAIFNIKNLDTGEYYGLDQLTEFVMKHQLEMVPLLDRLQYNSDSMDFDKFQKVADELKHSDGRPAEGIVLRPVIPKFSKTLGKMLSVKFINRNYKD